MKITQLVALLSILVISFTGCSQQNNAATADNKPNQKKFTFTYQVTIPDMPDTAHTMEIWLPAPNDNQFQKIDSIWINSSVPNDFTADSLFHNRLVHITFTDSMPTPAEIIINCQVTRKENNSIDSGTTPTDYNQDLLALYLKPDSLVPIDGAIAKEAKENTTENMTTMEKARALYDHLTKTMAYDKTGEGWGRGDATYACDIRKGNCTDFHSLFIGMCRSLGIPARFTIGFPLPENQTSGEIGGYHCWAEFYDTDKGWIPVDISEATKHPEKHDYLFGHLDPDRIAFSRGRDIPLTSVNGPIHANFIIYPYLLLDGRPYDGYTKKFSFSQL